MSVLSIPMKLLVNGAKLPAKAHDTDSGFDLFALEDTFILPGKKVLVQTGVAVKIPPGYDATVRGKSGITSKTVADTKLGTVDNGYTGEVKVIVHNDLPSDIHAVRMFNTVKEGLLPSLFRAAGIGMASHVAVHAAFEKEFNAQHYGRTVDLLNGEQMDVGMDIPKGTILIRKGEKFAQLVVHPYLACSSEQVEGDFEETDRGDGGFGSTGTGVEDNA